MLQLRPYQQEAVDAVFGYWQEEDGNPLVDLATGTGKSLVLAELIQRLVQGWPDMRIMVATHVAELIEQNYLELMGAWPFAPAGIYSAGLGRRDAKSQIIFAGIQTVHNKVDHIGHVDVLMVDEAHLIPANANTMYGRFINALKTINPDLKIVGLTATPYRLDSGRLDEGDDRLFDRVVYTYGIGDAIRDGYLAPLSSKGNLTEFDLKGVGKLGGDYKQGALQAAVDKKEVYEVAVQEIVAKGQNQRSWLIFGAGVDNALHIRDEIRQYGITCETITGETPKEERRRILEDFKAYRIRALTNNSVLTTGFNHKGVDLIAFMRPTLSVSLYVQMAGRGTRPLYAAGADMSTVEGRLAGIAASPKPSCLVLDFAKLSWTHGPVDRVEPKAPGSGNGEAPVKLCPTKIPDRNGNYGCDEILPISVMKCNCCGYEFTPNEEEKIERTASAAPILSTEKPWHIVTSQRFAEHPAKVEGKPNTVKIAYMVGFKSVNEWACPGHSGFPKSKADRYWLAHSGKRPFPKSAVEWLERAGELKRTAEIQLDYSKNPKYPDIIGHRPAADNDNTIEVEASNDNVPDWARELDDAIPF